MLLGGLQLPTRRPVKLNSGVPIGAPLNGLRYQGARSMEKTLPHGWELFQVEGAPTIMRKAWSRNTNTKTSRLRESCLLSLLPFEKIHNPQTAATFLSFGFHHGNERGEMKGNERKRM